MKIISKLSLRWRVTLLTAIILIICSCAFTAFSIYNAQQMLYPILENPPVSYPVEDSQPGIPVPAVPAQEQKELFDHKSICFCIFVTVFGTISVWFVSGKALKPIRDFNETIQLIDEHNLSERLKKTDTDDEIGQLTDGFNHMLSRLEDAFKRQKQFTASAAHELKTPLATVRAGIQVLDRDNNATLQDYKENAEIILKSVDRLTSVVNDLLLLASADERNQNMSENIDLDILFDTILSDISALYEKNNITHTLDLQANTIIGNAGMLYRAFYNLIENAYKYNRLNGEISIKSFSDKTTVSIEISDTGIGISEEHQPFIFEAFYRVDASRSRKIAGAGLGLSLVKAIIEQHGGTIAVHSIADKGTTFKLELPQ